MYSKECIQVFLKEQSRLFDEPVAETPEEAEEFLEECMAAESGADVEGLSDRELEESAEVFALPSGGYLIVEG